MTRALPDVNVLVAVLTPSHEHHRLARAWFSANATRGWATTPVTETGTVRLTSNPTIVRPPLTPAEAVGAVGSMRAIGDHQFWPDDRPVGEDGLDWHGVLTHRQVTDGRLVAIASRRGGTLVTLDRGLAGRYPGLTVLLQP